MEATLKLVSGSKINGEEMHVYMWKRLCPREAFRGFVCGVGICDKAVVLKVL